MSQDLRLLLVEDNVGDAALLRAHLAAAPETQTIVIQHELTLGGALRRLEAESFDLVLLDLNLPDSQNLDTARRMRQMAGDTPVVVLTGVEDEALALRALQIGVQDYLVKGTIDARALTRSARYAMERARMEAQLRSANRQLELLLQKRTEDLRQAITALGEEIIERDQVRGALAEVRRRFHIMVDPVASALPDAFLILTSRLDEMVYCNVAFERIWGRARQELSETPGLWIEAIRPDDRLPFMQSLEDWIHRGPGQAGNVLASHFRLLRPDGKTPSIRCRVFPAEANRKDLVHICILAEDVTAPSA